MRTAIVWFRNDLRIADHPALAAACSAAASVVPVYVHAPPEAVAWPPGAASRWWLHHSLAALDRSLRERGSGLIVVCGPSAASLRTLAAQLGASAVYWNRRYEPALAAHDVVVETELRAAGLDVVTCPGSLLFEPGATRNQSGGPFRVFTPYWRAVQTRLDAIAPPLEVPRTLGRASGRGGVPLESLGLLPRSPWSAGIAARFEPGAAGALRRLNAFLAAALHDYPSARDRPALPGTSRLSPHVHFGEISPRQVLASVRAAEHASARVGGARGAEGFLRQIVWREFAHDVLHHFPHTTEAPFDARFARHAWDGDASALCAWQRGATGVPLVDAGMRELWHTGWMHNRVRMVVASFLTKNLGIHWREGARWFFDTLVDADLANNSLGWQWVAGCGADAAPYYRIFNPVLQATRFDPAGEYLRRWLPELAPLPDEWLAYPAAAPPAVLRAAGVELGGSYPAPIVDLKLSRLRALERFAHVRGAAVTNAPEPAR